MLYIICLYFCFWICLYALNHWRYEILFKINKGLTALKRISASIMSYKETLHSFPLWKLYLCLHVFFHLKNFEIFIDFMVGWKYRHTFKSLLKSVATYWIICFINPKIFYLSTLNTTHFRFYLLVNKGFIKIFLLLVLYFSFISVCFSFRKIMPRRLLSFFLKNIVFTTKNCNNSNKCLKNFYNI